MERPHGILRVCKRLVSTMSNSAVARISNLGFASEWAVSLCAILTPRSWQDSASGISKPMDILERAFMSGKGPPVPHSLASSYSTPHHQDPHAI